MNKKQIEIQECKKSKFALICLFFGVLVWKRARDFSLCVAYFLSIIRNAPRSWMKMSLTEWPLLAPQIGTIYPFYRFYGYRIVLFYGYFFRDFFGPVTSGPLGRTSVRLYSVYKKNFIFASSNLKIQYSQCTNDDDSNDISQLP